MSSEREQIIEALRRAPKGLSGVEISALLGAHITRSKRLAILDELIAEGMVHAEGKTRARRYWLIASPRVEPAIGHQAPSAHPIFSSLSLAMFEALEGPQAQRPAVGYRRELLDAYLPNVTSYLGAQLAQHLNTLGRRLDSVAPAGTYARVIYQRFLIELSWSSARLEGNTYELLDTQRLLEEGEIAEGKSAVETRMLLNHKEAIRFLVESPAELTIDSSTISNLHDLLSMELLPDPNDGGRLRNRMVRIGGSPYIPLAVPQQISECFHLMLAHARTIDDPLECAFFLTVHLPYLQPFIDVNKRTARLAANIPLIIHNMCPLSFMDVEADDYKKALLVFYEIQELGPMRELFSWAYERSCARYELVEQSAPMPDRFRMRWDATIREGLAHLVLSLTETPSASPELLIEAWLLEQHVPIDAQPRLVAVLISDLLLLHEGNYARARVSRSQFERWRDVWLSKQR